MVLRKQFSEANLKIVNIQKQAVGALCDHEQATCENTVGSIKRDTYTETKWLRRCCNEQNWCSSSCTRNNDTESLLFLQSWATLLDVK